MHHPPVVLSQIFNYCLKVNNDGHTRLQIATKLLLQVSIREFHNILVSDPEDGGLKEARNAESEISISDSIFRSLFPPQQNKSQHNTRSYVVVNVVYLPKVYIPHYYHGVRPSDL